MRRRDLLRRAAAAATLASAGCTGAGTGDGDPTDGPNGDTESPTPTPTATPTPEPRLVDSEFRVVSVESGTGEDRAAVAFGPEVTVEGTVGGNDGCYTAELARAALEDGTLSVLVRAVRREDADACTEALVDVEYEATFAVEGPGPDRVVVEHDGVHGRTTVADAAR